MSTPKMPFNEKRKVSAFSEKKKNKKKKKKETLHQQYYLLCFLKIGCLLMSTKKKKEKNSHVKAEIFLLPAFHFISFHFFSFSPASLIIFTKKKKKKENLLGDTFWCNVILVLTISFFVLPFFSLFFCEDVAKTEEKRSNLAGMSF